MKGETGAESTKGKEKRKERVATREEQHLAALSAAQERFAAQAQAHAQELTAMVARVEAAEAAQAQRLRRPEQNEEEADGQERKKPQDRRGTAEAEAEAGVEVGGAEEHVNKDELLWSGSSRTVPHVPLAKQRARETEREMTSAAPNTA